MKLKTHKNIVIVGGGFAGVKAALEISKRKLGKVTLISDEPYFLHHATLYATATGRNRAESVISLVDIFSNNPLVTVVQDTMKSIDSDRRLVVGSKVSYKYDELIIAIGLVTTYFDIKGMDQHAFGIKTLDEVKAFNQHIRQDIIEDKHVKKTYVVVGAGPTGVELAGALKGYVTQLVATYKVKRPNVAITLVEAAPRILPKSSKTASRIIARKLTSMGVKVITNHAVQSMDDDSVTIQGKRVTTDTVIWTSGVANHPFFAKHPEYFQLAKNGRVEVDEHLQAYSHIYVLGDNNATKYSGMAWPALASARFIAHHLARKNAKKPLKKFRTSSPPSGIPVNGLWAYVEWRGIYVAGRAGFVLRRWMELYGYLQLLPYKSAVAAWRSRDLPETDI
ncbi:MAG TPA: FAD-dependent oxidoreductase [Candidatus Saccharimonadales bacterium]|nr:FAD-dependent oxidoreductase [Candidatus Saccharimonadales bacterium]